MKHLFMGFLLVIAATAAAFAQGVQPKVEAVPTVELDRYLGKWYEIAKYPNKFQKQCVGNTTATYSRKQNGRLEVLNECLKSDGTMEAAKGEAKIADKKTNSKLKVRFAPGYLSFLPFVWANYWVIDLAPDYSYAVIGEPKRDYFWILAREPEMDDATFQQILRKAEAMGFNPGRVERTPQKVETIPGGVLNRP
ncbi:MAG: lipocalin family protein [Acidobacteria bacterium]|nr:lipocalin family protein [Acidobacteriota bacterium]